MNRSVIIALLAATALHASPATPAANTRAHCSLHQLSACATTNQLVWDKTFQRQLKLFAGKARTNALGGISGPLSEDLLETLGGPPDEPVTLADGNLLFTACVAHNCTEKGAIVLTPTGSIVVAAMLTNHFVHEGNAKWTRSDDEYSRLDFFVRAPVTGEPVWHSAIQEWAKAAYADDRKVFDKYFPNLSLTESFWLVRTGSKELQKLASKKIIENRR
jgi:hypothetical protein